MKAHVNTTVEIDQIDMAAHDLMQVEIMPEVGGAGTFKLYIHEEGRTVVRVCKLHRNQINVDLPPKTGRRDRE